MRLTDYYRLRTQPAGRPEAGFDYSAWDRADVQAGHVQAVPGGCEITLVSDGMRCAACAWLIDQALRREDGVLEAGANAITGRIRLRWDPGHTRLSKLLERLGSLGYRVGLAQGTARERERRRERNRWLLRLGIAGLGSLQAMMFAEALYLDAAGQMPLATRDFFRWLTFLVATPVLFYAGWPFLTGAWREFRGRAPGMDTLVAGGALLAWAGSLVETLRGGPQVWYDTAVMFVFFLLAARLLEQGARAAATAQVDALARAQPALARRVDPADPTGTALETVPAAALEAGDVVLVAAGESLPADGILLDAAAAVDEALLTGESTPVQKAVGARVLAGSVTTGQALRLRVEAAGTGTRLSQLARLVEQAQSQRPPAAELADRVARHFVAGIVLIASCVAAGWSLYDPSRAFEVTLSLLVISCPCALSLSVPAALAAAHGALARHGVLVTRAGALEALAGLTDVVFDKTGTLSHGHPTIVATVHAAGEDARYALRVAAALERHSRHPLAAAFADAAVAGGLRPDDLAAAVSDLQEQAGAGLQGCLDGHVWRLGQRAFAAPQAALPGIDRLDDWLWLSRNQMPIAAFHIEDSPRPEASAVVRQLQDAGLEVHLLSGDAVDRVEHFAAAVGIHFCAGRLAPEDKLARVREWQALGRMVGMVGDGINDAPVLGGADVSIALASGAPLARQSADVVLVSTALTRIPWMLQLAQRARRIIRENLTWALGYNVVALPVAAAGLVTPWLAALAMVVSSLTVTFNALRLNRLRDTLTP
ncbi:MAG: cadmium-translocating P-type ATPase [Pseudomonadota bacterium]